MTSSDKNVIIKVQRLKKYRGRMGRDRDIPQQRTQKIEGNPFMSNYNSSKEPCQEVQQQQKNISRKNRVKEEQLPTEWKAISESVISNLVKRVTYYKYRNVRVCSALRAIGERDRANTINECGTFLKIHTVNGIEKFAYANFCRQRLCAVCGWRRSSKFVAQMLPVLRRLEAQGFRFVFATLTIPNVEANKVSESLTKILNGWDRLSRRKAYKNNWKGFCRSIEVTYNAKRNTYHPHIHILIATNGKYYNAVRSSDSARKSPKQMSKMELTLSEDWKNALHDEEYEELNYPLQVSLLPANRAPKRNNQAISAAAAVETLKYAVKLGTNEITNETISTFFYALSGRRLISFGGVIAATRAELGQKDVDENVEDLTDEIPEDADKEATEILYIFNPNGWKIYE